MECGADAVGFVLEPTSPRCVSKEELPPLVTSLPPFITRVTVSADAELIAGLGVNDAVQAITWGGGQTLVKQPARRRLLLRSRRRIQVIRISQGEGVAEALKAIDEAIQPNAVLLDAFSSKGYGGTGEKVDWGLAAEIVTASPIPVILAGGLNPSNVVEAIRKVRPYAVDVASGVETAPGIKDKELIRRFIEEARSAG